MPVARKTKRPKSRIKKNPKFTLGKAPHRRVNAAKTPNKRVYYTAAPFWFAAITALLSVLISFFLGLLERSQKCVFIGLGLLGLWAILKTIYYLATASARCPLCRANHLRNSRSVKHKKAYRILPFSYASTAIITAAFKRCVRCMHCGLSFDLTKKH